MKKMIWLDLEMTGLSPEKDHILEAAVLVADEQFNILESYETTVFQPAEHLSLMDTWCVEHHTASGLLARIPSGIAIEELDVTLAAISKKHFSQTEKAVLCGNSIWQDRRFVERHLPQFAATLHYRMLDVSAWKLVFESWGGMKYQKKEKHRALDDIQESIAELRYYFQFIKIPGLPL